ncbi:alpha/beta fold hydrolase [Streptomyces sp. NBC_01508]|uniref:alpha/beta fold hydrolase n=1 Tax=Streptomyces sp. NBC_01508 TaxID=2903888 RepID=UPI003866AF1B
MHDTRTQTLQVPGARLHYEVGGSGPTLLLIPGGPADAGALAALATGLRDRYTVVSYDQRGFSRSALTGPPRAQDVATFADDARRLIAALGDEPAYVFGNSGGALTGLDLAARHPGHVRALVAHEPPAPELLPDRAHWRATFQGVHDTYVSEGAGAAMHQFVATIEGDNDTIASMPDFSQLPPEAMEMMGRIQGNLDHFLNHVLLPVLRFEPDTAALRTGPVPVTVGIGTTSPAVGVPLRSALALAERLGIEPVRFPGDHQGPATDAVACAELVHDAFARVKDVERR